MSSVPAVIETTALAKPRELTLDAQQDIDGFRAIQYAAKLMMKSGCFADIKGVDEETSIAKAVVKIAIGRDYGFSCAESMQYIELIQGRPSIAAHGRAAKMKSAGYSWKFRKFDATVCDMLVFGPKGEQLGDSVFNIEDAKRMGLASKDNWVKNPRNMLYCRAVSNAQRWYAPEVLSASLATKEDVLDGDYTVVDTTVQPPDGDPRWLETGSVKAAEAVAEEKLQRMEADRAAKQQAQSGNLSGADDGNGNPPAAERPAQKREPNPPTVQSLPVEFESWDQWDHAGAPAHPLIHIQSGENAGYFSGDSDGNYKATAAPVTTAPAARPAPKFGRRG